MRVAVTGSSGLIGSALLRELASAGHDVRRLVRRRPGAPDEVQWDPAAHSIPADALDGVDAVVHLAGVGIADHRLTEDHKRAVLDSRIDGTTTIADAVARTDPLPVLLSASAVGWYGDSGARVVDESAPAGSGFLAQVCESWEGATSVARQAGARVLLLRSGLVLARKGGMLERMRPLFRAGLGGRLGSGKQYWPWISLADEVGAMRFLIESATDVAGPVNLAGPTPVTNAEFTATLGRILHRPTTLPVPRFALRAVLGEFADEGVLAGQRAVPTVLLGAGYEYAHDTLDAALRWAID